MKNNISLNFYGEEIAIKMPSSLQALRKEISEKFLFDPSEVLEIVLSYIKGTVKKFITSDQDLKELSKEKYATINLDISEDSKLYQEKKVQLTKEIEETKKLKAQPKKLIAPKVQKIALAQAQTTQRILRYNADAGNSFTDALPIGNGYMGGIIYGGATKDIIGLNESTVWSGGPGDNNKQGAANYLKDCRNALFSGNYGGAESIVNDHMIGPGPASFQPVGNLELGFNHNGAGNYSRELDLNTAIAKTKYSHDGVEYTREYFASYPDHVIVIRFSASQAGKVGFSAKTTTPHGNNYLHGDGDTLVHDVTVQSIKFQVRVNVKTDGGSVSLANNTINVTGADTATLILTIGTNFNSYADTSGNPGERATQVMEKALAKTYDEILEAHLKDYQALFSRVTIHLGDPHSSAGDNTINRIKGFNSTDDPNLVELYYQFGRYLMISSSRNGGQPANLQGIWNRDTNPAWGSKYTTNINLEMNYWMTESSNLPECAMPLINKVKSMVTPGQKTAQVHWGVNEGWVEHHNTDLWNRCAPIDGAWGLWPTGAGWLSTHLWEHYLFNPTDKDYLKDVYPTMKGAAQFFLNSMVEEPVSGQKYLVTAPSASPENSHQGKNVCFAPTMDNQIVRDVYNYTIKASEILGVDDDLRAKLEAAVKRIPPHKIGKFGQLQEWFEDWDDPKSDHRHVSHLYGMFPSAQITVDETPDLAEGAKNTLKQRGDLSTGWSLAWKINLWARLHDGDHAYNLIRMLLTPDRTYNNMFDAHPPFQIDGNFGAVSGIDEMLVQSHHDKIQLLPALPSKWGTGNVGGIRARGGFVIESMNWKGGKLDSVSISSQCGGNMTVIYGNNKATVETKAGETYKFDGSLKESNAQEAEAQNLIAVHHMIGSESKSNEILEQLNSLKNQKIEVIKNTQKKLEELYQLKKEEAALNKKINELEKKLLVPMDEKKLRSKKKKVPKEDEKKEVVHRGVICYGCKMTPIVGNRYKCTVCDNFNLCEKCEEKLRDRHKHLFLKIYKPEMCPMKLKCNMYEGC